jgi:hypothetical protein
MTWQDECKRDVKKARKLMADARTLLDKAAEISKDGVILETTDLEEMVVEVTAHTKDILHIRRGLNQRIQTRKNNEALPLCKRTMIQD